MDTYRTGGDIHDQTATVIFGAAKHNKEQRTIAKNVNFGTFYGLFPRGLQRTLKFRAGVEKSLGDCEQIISNLKAGYPKLTEWQESTKIKAKSARYSETALGAQTLPARHRFADWGKRRFRSVAPSTPPIQGTAATP